MEVLRHDLKNRKVRTRSSVATASFGTQIRPVLAGRNCDEDVASDTVHTLLRRLADWRIQSTRCDWLDVSAVGAGLASTGSVYFATATRYEFGLRRLETSVGAASSSSRRLPFRDRACDVLSVTGVLSRLDAEARRDLICELRRVLRPDGILAVFEENPFHPRRLLSPRRPYEGRSPSPSAMQECLVNVGLARSSRWYFSFKPAFLSHFDRVWERRLMHWPFGRRYAVCGVNRPATSVSSIPVSPIQSAP